MKTTADLLELGAGFTQRDTAAAVNRPAQFHNVFANSADAIASILALHFPSGKILDVNFGLGVFYRRVNREIVGVDLKPTGDVICDNSRLPFPPDSFEVGVCDPPYKRGNGNVRYSSRYGENPPCTEPRCTKLYHRALPELLRVCKSGVIVKCQDASDGHAFHPRHIDLCDWMKNLTGLKVHDVAVVIRWGVPDANTQGRRHYFQQALSYFLVWKWSEKFPFRPTRF